MQISNNCLPNLLIFAANLMFWEGGRGRLWLSHYGLEFPTCPTRWLRPCEMPSIGYFTDAELPPGSKPFVSWVPPSSPVPGLARDRGYHGQHPISRTMIAPPPSCCYCYFFALLLFKKLHARVMDTWVIPIEASLYAHFSPEVETTQFGCTVSRGL